MLSLILTFLLVGCHHAPSGNLGRGPAQTASPDDPLPVDPGVRIGKLNNGMSWYIETNREPAQRAALWLVVRAGSVLEDDDQQGLAHFLEHMAFNGTAHFAHNDLIHFIESAGMSFGPHLNAYTSFDQTVYQLLVPTDDPQLLDQTLVVLSDFAQGMSLDPVEVEKERGVVLEEWRRRRGAEGRLDDQLRPIIFQGSPYAVRAPIGTEESVRTFALPALQRFYKDWYRPDLMAIIAVGDFDPDLMQQRITSTFSTIPPQAVPRVRPEPAIPPQDQVLYSIFADPELTASNVGLILKHDSPEQNTHGYYREILLRGLVSRIANTRLQKLTRLDNPPCIGAGMGQDQLTPTEGAIFLGCQVPEGGIDKGLHALIVEMRRIAELGVGQGELDRAKADTLSYFQLAVTQDQTTESREKAEELVRHYTTREPMPGLAYEAQMAERFLAEVNATELSAFAKDWLRHDGEIVKLEQPLKEGLHVPDQAELQAVVQAAISAPLPPIESDEALPPLVKQEPTPGSVTSRARVEALGLLDWTLSNGVRVLYKQTDFQKDEVMFVAWSPGGITRVPDNAFIPASTAVGIAARSGLGVLDVEQLQRLLAGRQVGVSPYIGDFYEGFQGRSTEVDLELGLTFAWLFFEEPRFTPSGFDQDQRGRRRRVENRLADPQSAFHDAFAALFWQNHARHRPWTLDTLASMDLATSEQVFRQRFAHPGDFTFLFVGSMDPAKLEPLVSKWLGSIPTDGVRETPGDDGSRPAPGVLNQTVHAGIESKARFRMVYHGAFESTWLTRNRMNALAAILDVLLREEIREEKSGTYGVSVDGDIWDLPEPGYSVSIDFQCDPDRIAELEQAVLAVVDRLRQEGVAADYVERVKAQNRRERETSVRDNGFWLSSISTALQRGEDPLELLTFDARNESLSPSDIQEYARRYLDPGQVVKVVLLPEPRPATP